MNEIERAVALAREGETIAPRHLSRQLVEAASAAASSGPLHATPAADTIGRPAPRGVSTGKVRPLGHARAAFEANYIAEVLARLNGNVSRAAVALGVSRVTLQKKMKEYSLRQA
jgi:transcriptional regulator with PAS, ATPase and Fis domain